MLFSMLKTTICSRSPDLKCPTYSDFWGISGLILNMISILLLLFLYANSDKLFNTKQFGIFKFGLITIGMSIIIGASLYFNQPSLLYWNKVFSSFEYSSNPFLASISHLTIVTIYFLAANYLFSSTSMSDTGTGV